MNRMVVGALLLAGLACAASTSLAQAPANLSDVFVERGAVLPVSYALPADLSVRVLSDVEIFEASAAVEIDAGIALPETWSADTRSGVAGEIVTSRVGSDESTNATA